MSNTEINRIEHWWKFLMCR